MDVRKERSRDAARSRRGKENHEFCELAKLLPLPGAITSQLDKASVVRLAVSWLRMGEFSGRGEPPWDRVPPHSRPPRGPHIRPRGIPTAAADAYDCHQGAHILQSLDGFAFTLGADGRFLYISETVSIYLGLSQVEMCGSSIFDYIHAQDHAEFAALTGLTLSHGRPLAPPGDERAGPVGTHNPDVNAAMTVETNSAFRGLERAVCVRMKSTLTKRGCHLRTPGYRALLLQCRLRPAVACSPRRRQVRLLGLVAVAVALPPPSAHEFRLDGQAFVTRLTFDFRIAHCEPRVPDHLNFTSEALTGRSLYTLCHGADVHHLRKAHVDLLNKGQVLTNYYRLLSKNGGYTWLQTCATVVCSSKNARDQMILCINYVLTRTEYAGVVMDGSLLDDGVCLKAERPSELDACDAGTYAAPDRLDGDIPSSERPLRLETVKVEPEMVMRCNTANATHQLYGCHASRAEQPRGEKRRCSIDAGSPDGRCDELRGPARGLDCCCCGSVGICPRVSKVWCKRVARACWRDADCGFGRKCCRVGCAQRCVRALRVGRRRCRNGSRCVWKRCNRKGCFGRKVAVCSGHWKRG
ncbi:protein trachealess-like [Pollicipes pollicipes]|uniref:protein trachealess-like n=1 Tax=Pollicipes pollicipes TaxID=41117 RepID=UPI001884B461|nr:protein trachealess-like [Pollicipes pollicipes]